MLAPKSSYYALPILRIVEDEELKKNVMSDAQMMEHIIEVVSKYLQVPTLYTFKKSRVWSYVYFRQICMFFIRNKTKISYKQIGERFGGIDHTSVIHASNRIRDFLSINDEKVTRDVEYLNTIL